MFSVFKQARKVTFDYLIFLIVYVAFLPLVISIAKDNVDKWIPLYAFIVSSLLYLVIWSELYEYGRKEKKPMYNLDPSPHKGFLIGILGVLPFYILAMAAFLFNHLKAEELKFTPELIDIINNAFLSPVYFLIVIFGGSTTGYFLGTVSVPVVCYLAYLLGHKGITKNGIKKQVKNIFNKQQEK
jgi:hypothetical protein